MGWPQRATLALHAAFCSVRIAQTHLLSYDGLAADVPEVSSLAAVALLLVWVWLLEAPRRGVIAGARPPKLLTAPALRATAVATHGYYFSFATIYTLWYHPAASTVAHLSGFLYVFFLLLQSGLAGTAAHGRRWWTSALEGWVAAHALATAATVGGGRLVPLFGWGLATSFMAVHLHGFGLRSRVRVGVAVIYALGAALAIGVGWGGTRGWHLVAIPTLLYTALGGLLLILAALTALGSVIPLTAAAWAVLVANLLIPPSLTAASRFPFSAAATLPDEEALFAGGRDPFALEPDPFSAVSPGRRAAWARAHASAMPPLARRGMGSGGAVRAAATAFVATAATPLRTAVGVVLVGWPTDVPEGGEALAAAGPALRAAAEAAAAADGGGCTHPPVGGGRCPSGATAGVSFRLYRAPDVLGRQVAAAVTAGPAEVGATLAAAGSRGGMAPLEGGSARDAAGRPAGTLLYVVSTDLLGGAVREGATGWPWPQRGADGRARGGTTAASTANLLASSAWLPAGVGAVWTTGTLSVGSVAPPPFPGGARPPSPHGLDRLAAHVAAVAMAVGAPPALDGSTPLATSPHVRVRITPYGVVAGGGGGLPHLHQPLAGLAGAGGGWRALEGAVRRVAPPGQHMGFFSTSVNAECARCQLALDAGGGGTAAGGRVGGMDAAAAAAVLRPQGRVRGGRVGVGGRPGGAATGDGGGSSGGPIFAADAEPVDVNVYIFVGAPPFSPTSEGALSPAVAAYPAVGVALVSIPSDVNVTVPLVPAAAVAVAAAAYGVAAADLRRSGLLEALEGHLAAPGGATGSAARAVATNPNAELSDAALTAATDVLRAGAVYRLGGTVAAAAAGQVAGLLSAISAAGLAPSSSLGGSDLAAFGQRLTLAAYKLGAARSAWAAYPPAVPPPGGRRGAAAAAAAAAALAAASSPSAGTHPLAAVMHYAHSALRREATAVDTLWGRDVGLDLSTPAVCCGRRIDGPRRAARREAEARALKAEALSLLGGRRGRGAAGGGRGGE
ncbi:hypothetical protein MMPV_006436 [Pyropia vietnamensis]